MAKKNKYSIRKIMQALAWIAVASGAVALLIAAISRRNNERCSGVKVTIHSDHKNDFISRWEVLDMLKKQNKGKLEKRLIHQFDLASLESALDKSDWVKNAELYFDNNKVLEVSVTEREPIARVFTTGGTSFYLDSSLKKLPLSGNFSANVPVFTSFPTDLKVFTSRDSLLVSGISTLSQYIMDHPFWMAQIDQVNITPGQDFDLVTKLGDAVVHFGTTEDMQQKFNNLLCFYKEVLAKYGWSKYGEINVKFKGQIVATRRGTQEIKADSERSVEIMKSLIANAQKQSDEENNIQLSQQPQDNSSVNISKELGNTPDENKLRISVTPPIHVPEKTKSSTIDSRDPAGSRHSSSHEKPNPFPKNEAGRNKVIRPEEKSGLKRKPKAVMPSKTNH